MINKILIANRGEIACRIIHTAHKLGIQCIAIYSTTDSQALHVSLADEAYCIGPAPSKESYLNIEKIVKTAQIANATAIHPGYGFLAENAQFAQACEQANITFIGPPIHAITAMGDKSEAKKIMQQAGVPLLPSYSDTDQSPDNLLNEAKKIGFPVIIKAIAGGGGKGMRIVNQANEFNDALISAQREAKASFNNDKVMVEKYINQPRHIEIQIFSDQQNNSIYLFERDCSVQRRHQKIIEEAPAPRMDESLRNKMGKAAIQAAKAVNYVGAGTVEFLLDNNNHFYFMEMNTRLQVEHPVTEMITGIDLVEWQVQVASGKPLPLTQDELSINGHAFETRIYAEDPINNFLPATGKIHYLRTPATNDSIRIDSGICENDKISIYYDPMIAKLIVWGKTRQQALQKLTKALHDYQLAGVKTNISYLQAIINEPDFIQANIDTHFIEQHPNLSTSMLSTPSDNIILMAGFSYLLLRSQKNNTNCSNDLFSPWSINNGWLLNNEPKQIINLKYNDESHSIIFKKIKNNYIGTINNQSFNINGELKNDALEVTINDEYKTINFAILNNALTLFYAHNQYIFTSVDTASDWQEVEHDKNTLTAPMPGTIIDILVSSGDKVEKNTKLVIVEAMKMEHTITASAPGTIKSIHFKVGDLVDEGVELLALEYDE